MSPDNLRAHSWSYECLSTTCPGFDVLQGLLSRHSHLPRVFEALAALMLERKAIYTADGKVGTLHLLSRIVHDPFPNAPIMCHPKVPLDDMLQSLIDSQADSPAQQLCVEAATILLELVKVIITKVRM